MHNVLRSDVDGRTRISVDFVGATIQDEAGSQRDIFYHMRFKFASMVHLVPCRTTDVCNEAQRILREVDLSNFYHECMLSVCPLSP